jgi:hypothetical protein
VQSPVSFDHLASCEKKTRVIAESRARPKNVVVQNRQQAKTKDAEDQVLDRHFGEFSAVMPGPIS